MQPRASRLTTAVALATAVVLALLGGTANAAWSVSGSGTGAAKAQSLNAPTASATAQSSSSIQVTWTVGTQPPGTTYSVVRNGTTTLSCTSSPCTDTGLAGSTSYSYVVTAKLGSAWVASSNTTSATTPTSATRGTNTALTSNQNPVRTGATVTFTATVSRQSGTGTPTGSVTFKDGSGAISCVGGSQTLNSGVATCQTTFSTFGAPRSITAVYSGDATFLTSTSSALSQRVVNGAVAGFAFTNVKVGATTASFHCDRADPANVTCTVDTAGGVNAALTADVQFVTSDGTPVAYATDLPTTITWGAGKNVTLNQSTTIAAGATGTTGSALSGTKNGSNQVVIAVKLTDAGATYNASITLN